MFSTGIAVFVCAFVISCLSTLFMRRRSIRAGFLDVPTDRKNHDRAVPLGGGQAMYFSFVVTILAGYAVVLLASRGWHPGWLPSMAVEESGEILAKWRQILLIAGVGAGMVILGWLDDVRDLSPLVKLLIQAALAAVLVAGGISVTVFIHNKILAGIITVLWIVGVVNAFNFLDNMDGLCAGVAFVAGTLFAIVAVQTGQTFVAVILLAYLGMLAGFLVFNFHPASIFMGDAGSLSVGYIIAVLTVVFTFRREAEPVHAILTPLLILALPVFDMAYVMAIRIYKGAQLHVGDHSHVSHRLVSLGMTPRTSVLTIYLMTFCTGLAAIMMRQLNTAGALCAVIQVISFLILIFLIEGSGRET